MGNSEEVSPVTGGFFTFRSIKAARSSTGFSDS